MLATLSAQFEENDRRIFWLLLTACVIALACYVYFISISVYAVVARKSAEDKFEGLKSRVSILESEYVALDKRINLDLAHQSGFVDIPAPRYISRERERDTLTLRINHVAP